MEGWHFVNVAGNEYVRAVETGNSTLQMQVRTNLRDVDHIAIVSCVRKILREGIGKLRCYASCWTQAERRQQSMITRCGAGLPVNEGAETSEGSRSVNTVIRIIG